VRWSKRRALRKSALLLTIALVSCVSSQSASRSSGTPLPSNSATGGASLYETNCSGCHGTSGQGAVNIAPPLAKNPYVTGDPKKLIRAVANGVIGPVKERGATWSGSMPPWQGTLSNVQLAEVISFVRRSWGNNAPPVTERQVASLESGASVAAQAPSSAPTTAVTASAQALYATNCSGCHGTNGQGAVNIAPPLAKNPYVTGDPKRVVRAVASGLIGPVKERGMTWSGSMPPWRGTLSDAELAAVISYIRTSWGNKSTPVTASLVSSIR